MFTSLPSSTDIFCESSVPEPGKSMFWLNSKIHLTCLNSCPCSVKVDFFAFGIARSQSQGVEHFGFHHRLLIWARSTPIGFPMVGDKLLNLMVGRFCEIHITRIPYQKWDDHIATFCFDLKGPYQIVNWDNACFSPNVMVFTGYNPHTTKTTRLFGGVELPMQSKNLDVTVQLQLIHVFFSHNFSRLRLA